MKRWKLITGVLFVFLAGALVGVLGTNYYVHQRYFGIKHRPQERTAFITDRLTERLKLDDAQKSQVYEMIQDMHKGADKIFRGHRAEVDQYMDREMEKVRDLLDHEQQEEFDRMMKEIKERRKKWQGGFPPPGGPRGPGGPGPPGPPGPPPGPHGPEDGSRGFPDGQPGPPPPPF